MNNLPVVMVVGGMDPSGGAGIIADTQTLASMGCHTAPVVTALTVQDTIAVSRYELVEINLIEQQMLAILQDLSPVVVKTGMLANAEIVRLIANILQQHPGIKLVIDPVMSSNNDESLSEDSLCNAIKEHLFPLATIITPNLPEACLLAGISDADNSSVSLADECALRMQTSHCLITGTHADSVDVVNHYYAVGRKINERVWPRLEHEYHGSGCTLASAIAAGIANGLALEQAVSEAQEYVINSLSRAFKAGRGQLIPNRLKSPHSQ